MDQPDPRIRGRLYRWWRMLLRPSQAYYWTRHWQEQEAESRAENERGEWYECVPAPVSEATNTHVTFRFLFRNPGAGSS